MILVAVCALVYFLKPTSANQTNPNQAQPMQPMQQAHPSMFQSRANYGVSNSQGDVLLNPYVPPMRDDRATLDVRGPVVPINVSTQGGANAEYRQVGILTRISGPETILPLMGRPLFRNRDKWQFYTISEKSNFIKLPVSVKGRSCTNEYGCDNVYNGDTVYVEGYNDAFKVTAYENAVMQYLPG
uniref:Uncharacterized protein n=1 Tax=viral metagenome TaxID=1070528 RepID=A0A6C0M2U8_9ZZZZ